MAAVLPWQDFNQKLLPTAMATQYIDSIQKVARCNEPPPGSLHACCSNVSNIPVRSCVTNQWQHYLNRSAAYKDTTDLDEGQRLWRPSAANHVCDETCNVRRDIALRLWSDLSWISVFWHYTTNRPRNKNLNSAWETLDFYLMLCSLERRWKQFD